MSRRQPGAEAIRTKGRFAAHKWLLARRASQCTILSLFLLGPLTGWWIVKGNLAYSLTLDTLPLTDPFILMQSLVAGHRPESLALLGVAPSAAEPIGDQLADRGDYGADDRR